MSIQDINETIQEFKLSSQLAKEAGFDGVELHAANGYLVDQFFKQSSNQRKDKYGGSVENRCRFALEIMDEINEVFPNRCGIRVSPTGRTKDMFCEDPIETFSYLLKELDKRNIAFVEIKEAGNFEISGLKALGIDKKEKYVDPHKQCADLAKTLRKYFKNTLINNDGFDNISGIQKINLGHCDLISFGKYTISNPDLPLRFKNMWPLIEPDRSTYYTSGSKGYTDYKTYEETIAQKSKTQ